MENEIIYRKGSEANQIFVGEERKARGISHRANHLTTAINIHDSFKEPVIEEGHVHTAGYEAIMLLWGDIDALTWEEEITVYPLKKRDDLIIFPSGSHHTLIVNEKSRIIVIKDFLPSSEREQRQKVELPASIETLRQAVLKGEKSLAEALKEAKTKLEKAPNTT